MLSYGFSFVSYVMDEAKGNVDLAIMDISIGEDNGVQIIKSIHEKYPHIKVIYLTSYIKYAEDVFETNPVYFLVKPIKDERLFAAIDRAITQIKRKRGLYQFSF